MPLQILPVILIFSILLQISSAAAALLMVRTSGYYQPWIFIAVAIFLMGVRRITSFIHMLQAGVFPSSSIIPEIIALCISILMLTGLILLRPMFLDITEKRRNSELDIKRQKILLKETNHRVKNNLLMITSLIKLKERALEHALEHAIDLSDIIHQIDTIRIIHEKLYQTDNPTYIRVKDYIPDLINTVFSAFSNRKISIETEIDDLQISSDTAIAAGLIINEIATNAIKYGFTNSPEAVFRLSFHRNPAEEKFELNISNTGAPFPEEIDLNEPATLGLRLITSLTAQLKGTINLIKNPSPEYQIAFPSSHSVRFN